MICYAITLGRTFIRALSFRLNNHSLIFVNDFTVGAGVTVWSCTENIHASERKQIKSVLDSFGKTVGLFVFTFEQFLSVFIFISHTIKHIHIGEIVTKQ